MSDLKAAEPDIGTLSDDELEVVYPENSEDAGADASEDADSIIAELAEAAQRLAEEPSGQPTRRGRVSNARNATSTSEEFTFWAPSEEEAFGIGAIVRHDGVTPRGDRVTTYGVVVETQGQTLGLDDQGIDVYEKDGRPPLEAIVPASSRRRPVDLFRAKVLTSTAARPRPVQTGPVAEVCADQLLEAHGTYLGQPKDKGWLDRDGIVLGFYQDANNGFGVFAEERARVLGPKQGHALLSGAPGAGKTSLFLMLIIALYAQLLRLAGAVGDRMPKIATVAFNVKGADLLFLDHLDSSELSDDDVEMWHVVGIDTSKPPFGRVLVYVPLAEDGLNRDTLRTNPDVDVTGYSETREFSLGIADLWPHLSLFFDERSSAAATLLAEVYDFFTRTQDRPFTLANVLNLFDTTLLRPQANRANTPWQQHSLATIRSVYNRLHALSTMLGGLVDATGNGFGLDDLADLQSYDLVVIDLERIMADPSDPEIAEIAIKIITRYVLQRITEAVTRGRASVDNVIVFADELNRLAPARGDSGVGEYLAHLARTTRDRGVVLFGAGQFRSGINSDILKAAAVHYSMQTPEYELDDAIYRPLTGEFKSRLSCLRPGETLLQFPSLRSPVFARFPRPFLLGGATGPRRLPPADPRPLGECIADRLRRIDPNRPPAHDEVLQIVDGFVTARVQRAINRDRPEEDARRLAQRELLEVLRGIEMGRVAGRRGPAMSESPWEEFGRLILTRASSDREQDAGSNYGRSPDSAFADVGGDDD